MTANEPSQTNDAPISGIPKQLSTYKESKIYPDRNIRKWQLGGIGLILGLGALAVAGQIGAWITTYNSHSEILIRRFNSTLFHDVKVRLSPDDLGKPDKQFIEMTVPQLEEATAIASSVLTSTKNTKIKELSNTEVQSDRAQIKQLREWYAQWREQWYGVEHSSKTSELQVSTTLEDLKNHQISDREFIRQILQRDRTVQRLALMVADSTGKNELRALARDLIASKGETIEGLRDVMIGLNPETSPVSPLSNRSEFAGAKWQQRRSGSTLSRIPTSSH